MESVKRQTSRPLRGGRGLKPRAVCACSRPSMSPPAWGAWIETAGCPAAPSPCRRRPLRGGRGLKLRYMEDVIELFDVAPCVGAWIETPMTLLKTRSFIVAPCVGGVD